MANASIAAAAPSAPASLTATATAGGASLSWAAPASDGGATITGYVLSYGTVTVTLGATLAATVGGLAPGGEYAFALRAANTVGLGAAATVSVAVPAVAPQAPAGFTASAIAGGASLSWSAPASDGGAAITGYVLSYDAETVTLGATLAATVGGLAPGGEYAFALRAANSVGLGATATALFTVPAVAPGAPEGFTASAIGGGVASLSWGAPAEEGGAAVTGYVLSYGATTINLGATTAATVGGVAGEDLLFTLRAANAVGLGAAATAGVSVPPTPPAAPVGLRANSLPLAASLAWQAPAANGAPITNYVLSYGTVTANLGVVLATTIGSLTAGGEYVFTLVAQNSVGLGAGGGGGRFFGASGRAGHVPAGFVASAFAASAFVGGASLSWSAPTVVGSSTITAYLLSYGGALEVLPATASATVINDLAAGASYIFTLQAANSVGAGSEAVALATVPAVAPGAPLSLTAVVFAEGAGASLSLERSGC